MEPQTKYVTMEDGGSTAYWAMGDGEGAPYVMPRLNNPAPKTHIAVTPELGRQGEAAPKT